MEKLNTNDMMVVSGGEWFGYFCAGFAIGTTGATIYTACTAAAVTSGVVGLAVVSIVGISCAVYTLAG